MNVERSLPETRALAYALAAAVGGMVLAAALPLGLALLFGSLLAPLSVTARVAVLLVLTDVGFGLAVFAYLRLRDLEWSYVRVGVPSLVDVGWTVAGYVATVVLVVLAGFVVSQLGVQAAENEIAQVGRQNPTLLLWLVPMAFVFIGPFEELLFRGVVQQTLREAFSPYVAIPVASAVFAVIHVVALSGGLTARLTTVAILFLPSLVLGTMYEKTGNLVPSAFVHGAYDATLFALLYVSIRYADQIQSAAAALR